jgi:hypothetical protein
MWGGGEGTRGVLGRPEERRQISDTNREGKVLLKSIVRNMGRRSQCVQHEA